ncbi:MAG: histidinol-phosphate aminotransferase family protein [Candidatus Methanofastidiosa archaeon]|nr:histidinol-phosphate aminotransferase family protein [Candidatus Methanofastidiosa archaeon]
MIEKLVRRDIETLRFKLPYVDEKLINLSQNEPIRGIIGDKYSSRYIGPFYYELKDKIARKHGLRRENLVITAGANHGIDICCRCFLERGDSCAIYEPTYGQYYMIARVNGNEILKFQLNERFEPDWDLFKKSAAKLLFLSNPNNPTGNLVGLDKIEEGLKTGKVIVVDEAYAEFTDFTAIELVESYENLVVLRTFSKVWSLPGARVGYTVANEKTSDYLELSHIPYHMSNMAVKLAYDVLDHEEDMWKLVEETKELREEMRDGLSDLGLYAYPSYTNFVLVEFPEQVSAYDVFNALIEKGIFVYNVSGQNGIENCLRISVGARENNLYLLKSLGEVLADWGTRFNTVIR